MKHEPAGILERLVVANEQFARELAVLLDRVRRIEDNERLPKEWYTLVDCARLKGVSESSLRERWRQPLGGHGRKQISGMWRWHRDVVVAWLLQDDEELLRTYGRQPREGVA